MSRCQEWNKHQKKQVKIFIKTLILRILFLTTKYDTVNIWNDLRFFLFCGCTPY